MFKRRSKETDRRCIASQIKDKVKELNELLHKANREGLRVRFEDSDSFAKKETIKVEVFACQSY